jgi:hypothetical protein
MSKTEQEIERLVEEINRVIQRDPPDQRRELRSYASSLIADMATESIQPSESPVQSERRPFGLVAAGLALLVVGGGFVFIIPPIGLTLVSLGVVLAIWGAIAGWWMMRADDAQVRGHRPR